MRWIRPFTALPVELQCKNMSFIFSEGPKRFFGIRNSAYLNSAIWDFRAKVKRDLGLLFSAG